MAKYAHRSGFIEAERNKDGSYTISGVSRMSKEQFEQEFIEFPESRTGEWLFISSRPLDLTLERYKGLHESWAMCFESGFECSICGTGSTMGIGPAVCDDATNWSIEDERSPFCPHCGASMKYWNETYEEWKKRNGHE